MDIPEHLKYTEEHEWLSLDGDVATVGVTDFAQDSLGDIVFVELPDQGDKITAGEPCGELESTKSVSELYAPADGEVVAVNEAVRDTPELVNSDPYGEGWLFRVRVGELPDLLDAADYAEIVKE
ncbi:glycine cleavage system protein GcvH [Haloechinothrix halophila]|uniref:glycine cleavage system protein GcvH n=1 Tax=Haloechinothrix halophila TaxID=1069073 RepID=UPI000409C8B9|nr:glycine cleavage system protein GcvH [Haloechinothrix halophila]